MTKKSFDEKLDTTVERQDEALQERFDKADSILLKSAEPALEKIPQKSSVVRDTFSMPPADCALIETLRTTAARDGRIVSKSEIIRAGLHALCRLNGPDLVEVIKRLEKVKPGRKN
jgi:hypothetical protein